MRNLKTPPPDTVENVLGRILALQNVCRKNAKMATREGGDYETLLLKELAVMGVEMRKLESRLVKTQKGGANSVAQGIPKATQATSKLKTAISRVPADYDDLLTTLKNL